MPKAEGRANEEPVQREGFFLKHLQEVRANEGIFYNQRFIGKGGNGTAFLAQRQTFDNCQIGPLLSLSLRILFYVWALAIQT